MQLLQKLHSLVCSYIAISQGSRGVRVMKILRSWTKKKKSFLDKICQFEGGDHGEDLHFEYEELQVSDS